MEEVSNEALEGSDLQQNPISSSTREDDGVEAHHYSSSTENDGAEAHIPSEDDRIHSSEDDQFSLSYEDGHFSHEDGEDVWVSNMIEKCLHTPERLRVSSGSRSCSIHRVPYSLRKHNEDAYNPQLISIGPFHYEKRENDQLRTMEEHKWNYLRHIISRQSEHHPDWLKDCYLEIRSLEEDARNCYSEEIKVNMNDFDFLEIMVLDGFFIVEFLRRYWRRRHEQIVFADDVILQLAWPASALWCDLVLLENQIPFFILQKLSDLIDADRQDADLERAPSQFPPLKEMALNFFFPGSSTEVRDTMIEKLSQTPILHLLHLLYVCLVPNPAGQADINPSTERVKSRRPMIPSASKLKEAGIRFKSIDNSASLGIRFDNGVIEIPKIHVSDCTKKKFLNLIAFEQCYVHCCSKTFTNFGAFMDSLIDTAADVEILHDKGIIYNALGNNGLVASEFSSIAREESVSYDPDYLTEVCKDINEYKDRCWPRWRASFVHDYFRTPWAPVSVIAGSLLLLFSFTQTFFTVFFKFALHAKNRN